MNDTSSVNQPSLIGRIEGLEARMARIEGLLVSISEKLEGVSKPLPVPGQPDEAIVTLLARQLERLVPETCNHAEGHPHEVRTLEGTNLRCTEEVAHRIQRIPIPFVRELVVKKLGEYAIRNGVEVIDLQHFEKGATF